MLTRGARAERQAKLRLLESVRLETDAKCKQLEQKHAAIPALTPAQAEEVWPRVRAMSPDEIVEFLQDYPLRMAGKNAFSYVCWDPRETPHKDDPELAAAVEAVNLALHANDKARLNLRIAELFGGRASHRSEAHSECSAQSKSALIQLDLLELFISGAKAVSFYESLAGGNLLSVERKNFNQLGLPNFRAGAKGKAEEQSTEWDRAHGAPRNVSL